MRCQLCYSNYDHLKHRPYVLIPCTHTCCVKCLDDLDDLVCPICKKIIHSRNPNWALLDLIPNQVAISHTERLRKQLQLSIDQTEELKNKLNDLNKQCFKENVTNIAELKKEITDRCHQLVSLVNECQEKMTNDAELIETNYEIERLNQIKHDHHIDTKIRETRKRLNKNELTDEQLQALINSFKKKCSELSTTIVEKKEAKTLYELVPAATTRTTEYLIGKISLRSGTPFQLDEKAYHAKGIRLLEDENYEEAIECFTNALEINAMCTDCYNFMGLAMYGLKEYEKAVQCFEKSIQLDPNRLDIYVNKGNALKELKDYNGAIKCFSLGLKPTNKCKCSQ